MGDRDEAVWTEVSLRATPATAEAVADRLQALTGAGVAIEPPIRALGPDEGYTLDAAAPLTLRAYLRGPIAVAFRRAFRRRLGGSGVVGRLRWCRLREVDWAEAWKAYYDVERVGSVVIRPAWLEYAAQPGEVVVDLDPGIAFGTGQHPTTRMCLQALQQLLGPGARVLDLGCGSGILALAARALGAGSVLAADTEEQAVAATRANLALNAAEAEIEVRHGSIDAAAGAPFDLILANINAATLSELAPALRAALAPGGVLVAGGVIAGREAACAAALEAAGLHIDQRLREGDWRTFVLSLV